LIPAWNAARAGREHATAILLTHLGCCLVVMFLATSDTSRQGCARVLRVVHDWAPLVAVPVLYAELPDLIFGAGSTFHDQLVQGWEASVFGASPAHVAGGRWPWTALSELLHLGYLSYYAIIYVPPLWLYLRNEQRDFRTTITALTITFTGCFAVFVFFPVAGPRYLWNGPPGIPDGPVRRLALTILAAGSSKGAAFPSSHVAVATVQSVMMLRHHRAAGVVVSIASLLLALGAVYGGFHYGIDVLAGAVAGGLIATATVLASARLAGAPLPAGPSQPVPSAEGLS
jgi:membrane-associated phospholipid phosphatase